MYNFPKKIVVGGEAKLVPLTFYFLSCEAASVTVIFPNNDQFYIPLVMFSACR